MKSPGPRVAPPGDPPPDDDLEDLLLLRAMPGIGDLRMSRLLKSTGGSARLALRAVARDAGPEAASAMRRAGIRERAHRAARTARAAGVQVLRFGRVPYPPLLERLDQPPPVLFARGRLDLLDTPVVTVVGTRRSSPYGREVARQFSRAISRAGVVVASGLARGIDAIAHEQALATGTVAVLGTGPDVCYPRSNAGLQDAIAARGLLVSEFLPGTGPERYHFPRRNRILAALARVVLVVEAGGRSGALNTASHALDLGITVMAVPGPVNQSGSVGCNELIRDGAVPALHPSDVIEAVTGCPEVQDLRPVGPTRPPAAMGPDCVLAWDALADGPRHVDRLADLSGLGPADLLAALLSLELDGYARRLPGQFFVRQ